MFGLFCSAVSVVTRYQLLLFIGVSLGPYLLLITTEAWPANHNSRGAKAVTSVQRVAVVWYLAAYLVGTALAVLDGISAPEAVFLIAALLGVWPCLIALSRWRTWQ